MQVYYKYNKNDLSITIFYEAWNILYEYYNQDELNPKLKVTEEEGYNLYSNLTEEEKKKGVTINSIGDKSYEGLDFSSSIV